MPEVQEAISGIIDTTMTPVGEKPNLDPENKVNLLPIIDAIKQRLLQEPTIQTFTDLVSVHLRTQIPDITNDEYEKSVSKVERNALAALVIEHVFDQFSKNIKMGEKKAESETDRWSVTIESTGQIRQIDIIEKWNSSPIALVEACYIYKDPTQDYKLYVGATKPEGFSLLFLTRDEDGNLKLRNSDSMLVNPIDIFDCTALFLEYSFQHELQDTIEEARESTHDMHAVFSRLETMLKDTALNVDIENQGDRPTSPEIFIFSGFRLAAELNAALARLAQLKLDESQQEEYFDVLEKLYNIPAALAKKHINHFRNLFSQITEESQPNVPGEPIVDPIHLRPNAFDLDMGSRLGKKINFTEIIKRMLQQKPNSVATGCPALPNRKIKELFELQLRLVPLVDPTIIS